MPRWSLTKLNLAKGGHSSYEQKQADQQRNLENQLTQQQLAMQQKQLASVNAATDPIIAAGGMSPQQEAALRSMYMNNIPAQFKALQGGINNQLVARGITGGANAGGGDIARQFGALGAAEGGLQQQGEEGLQAQKYGQLMQALGLKLGIGGQYGANVGGFNSGAIGAGNTATTAANNADQAQTSFMGSLMGALTSPFSFTKAL